MKKSKIFIIIFIISSFLLIYTIASLWISSNYLTVKKYEFTTEKVTQEVTLVVLSDLHDHEFGFRNEELVKKTAEQHPDVILLDGDFLNEDSENGNIPCELIEKLVEIAPVYFALGNHELSYIESNHPDLIQQLQEAGAVVLDKEYVDLEIGETSLRLGGMYDYAFGQDGNNTASNAPEDVRTFLEDFQNTDCLKIMMSHRPDSFIFGDAASYWDIDLVISGHNHGGQVVVPFLGGLYGGDQGWFPEYVHGMYQKDGMNLFVTSGLGSHDQILKRFNNPPEIAVLKILPS